MTLFKKNFLLGAATAAFQVEGNNKNSDTWVEEQLPHSGYEERSLMRWIIIIGMKRT